MASAAALITEPPDPETREEIVALVRQFTYEQIIPNAEHYDSTHTWPGPIVEGLKELGLFGVTLPEEYGGEGTSDIQRMGLAKGLLKI